MSESDYLHFKAEAERFRLALEEIAAMPDSDWQDRTHQCVARQALEMPKCEYKTSCKVCWIDQNPNTPKGGA